MMVQLSTFESPYKRTLGALSNTELMRAPLDLYLRQAADITTDRAEQILYALEKMSTHTHPDTLREFLPYVRSLGAESSRGVDMWLKAKEDSAKAAEASRKAQGEAAAQAASEQARAYREAMARKAEQAEATRAEQAEAAAQAASEQAAAYAAAMAEQAEPAGVVESEKTPEEAEAAAASNIVDIEAAAAVQSLETTIEAAQSGKATPEQVEAAAAVAAESLDRQARKNVLSKIVPLTIAAGLFILIMKG